VCTTFVDVVYICRHADFSSESDDAAATPAASAAEASRENSTQPPAEVRNRCLDMFLSFAMSGSVCLSVCLIMLYIACISKTTCRNLPDFLCLLSMAMFLSEHNAVRYVLLVFVDDVMSSHSSQAYATLRRSLVFTVAIYGTKACRKLY